jgi:hypothetical protein
MSVFVLSSPLDLLTYHCPVRSSMHAAVAVDQRHIRSKKLRPLIVPMYAQRPAWQAWRGLCFRMSGPRDWDATYRLAHWSGGGEGRSKVLNSSWRAIAPTHHPPQHILTAVGASAPRKSLPPPSPRAPGDNNTLGHSTRYFRTDSLTLRSLSPHLMHPAAAAAAGHARQDTRQGSASSLPLGPSDVQHGRGL